MGRGDDWARSTKRERIGGRATRKGGGPGEVQREVEQGAEARKKKSAAAIRSHSLNGWLLMFS